MVLAMKVVLSAFCLLEVQSILFHFLPFPDWRPSFPIPIVLYLGLYDHKTTRGALLSFFIGYLWDIFSGGLMGLHTFILVVVYYFSRVLGVRLFLRGSLFHAIITFGVTLFSSGVIVLISLVFTQNVPNMVTLIYTVFPRSILTTILAPFLFIFLHNTYYPRVTGRREEFVGI